MKKGLTLEVCDLDHDAAVDPPELAAEATGEREGGRGRPPRTRCFCLYAVKPSSKMETRRK